MSFASQQWKTRCWFTAESLLTLSVHAVASYLCVHLENLQNLPKHLKSKILSVAITRGCLSNSALKSLVHADILELDLSECPVCDETLQIVSAAHSLRKLDINPGRNQRRNVSADALKNLFPSVPHLSILYMRRCDGVSDDVISSLVECCPLLRELDVGGCVTITDHSLRKLKDLENLISLNVSSSQVSDHGILALVEGNCAETLTELRLDSCQRITDFAIESIVLYCSNMKVLIFHGCPVTDASKFALEELLSKSKVKQLTWTVY